MDCLEARLGDFRLKVDPARGGKVVEIRHDSVSRNLLLDAQPGAVLSLEHGDQFDVSGCDEIVPTLEPEADIPTLGYAWRTGADCTGDGSVLCTRWTIPGWSVKRESRAAGNTLSSRSLVHNTRETSQPAIWAVHALYPLEGMLQVTLPGGEPLPGPGCEIVDLKPHLDGKTDEWRILDFANIGRSWKFFLEADRPVRMEYADISLTIETDAPWWGIWLNRGGYCGMTCIGVEPTTDPTDYLRESTTIVPAGEAIEHTWSLTACGGPTTSLPQ